MKVKILIVLKSFDANFPSEPAKDKVPLFGNLMDEKLNEKSLAFFPPSSHKVPQRGGGENFGSFIKPVPPKSRYTLRSQRTVSIALPKKQSKYTILRSPHIDKKSRDQFSFIVHKRLIVISTEIKQIRKKLFNLKFHDIPGVQMKVIFQTKTRFDSQREKSLSIFS